jgi:hypothetical protein
MRDPLDTEVASSETMPNQVTRSRQQEMQFRTHGGARPGAGRKPSHPGRARLRHGRRPALAARFPVHVTKRVRRDVTRLRRFELCKVLREAFVHGCR